MCGEKTTVFTKASRSTARTWDERITLNEGALSGKVLYETG